MKLRKRFEKVNFIGLGLLFIFILSVRQAPAGEHKVGMEGWEFHPPELTINVGDTVTWVNDDDTTHNIYFEDPSLGGPTKEAPLKIRVGKSYSLTFNKPGEYRYYCGIHIDQDMVGKVIVK